MWQLLKFEANIPSSLLEGFNRATAIPVLTIHTMSMQYAFKKRIGIMPYK